MYTGLEAKRDDRSRDAGALPQPRSQGFWEMLRATLYLNVHRSPWQSRMSPRVRLECNPEIPVAPGEEPWLLDTSLAIISFFTKIE